MTWREWFESDLYDDSIPMSIYGTGHIVFDSECTHSKSGHIISYKKNGYVLSGFQRRLTVTIGHSTGWHLKPVSPDMLIRNPIAGGLLDMDAHPTNHMTYNTTHCAENDEDFGLPEIEF